MRRSRRPLEVKIRYVDGPTVRRNHVDFTMGCHWVQCSYIPRGQVWIEKHMTCIDKQATQLHELYEVDKMLQGWSYNKAHAAANRLEQAWRRKHRKCAVKRGR